MAPAPGLGWYSSLVMALACLCEERREVITKAYKELYRVTVESMYLNIVGPEINQVLRSEALSYKMRVTHE